jgi:transcriptional regulator with GAF, ATPase, and Fis domain
LAYDFPGNIRELEHRIERAVLLANDDEPLDLPHLFQGEDGVVPAMLSLDREGNLRQQDSATLRRCATELLDAVQRRPDGYAAIEREVLEVAVADARGNLSAAARRLGLTRRQVAVRLERLRQT